MLQKPPAQITLQKIKDRYAYDPSTGEFTWRKVVMGLDSKITKIGDRAGKWKGAEYLLRFDGHYLNGRRVAWWIMTGEWPQYQVKTRNGDPRDLRWENLVSSVDAAVERIANRRTEIAEKLRVCISCGCQLHAWRNRGLCDGCRASRTMSKRLAKLYGLKPEDVAEILRAQNYVCEICGEAPETGPRIDHDHATGRVRGILCGPCNTGLGHFGDSAERLRRAASYLTA